MCNPTAHSLSLAPSRGPPCNCTSPQALESGQRIVLDLSFADLMREGELKSICSQLGYCWHANCSAAQPAHMVLSSVEVRRSESPRCGTPPSGLPRGYSSSDPHAALVPHHLCVPIYLTLHRCAVLPDWLQGKMKEFLTRQITGYSNWKATITPQVCGMRVRLCACACSSPLGHRRTHMVAA